MISAQAGTVLLEDSFTNRPKGAEPSPPWNIESGDWTFTNEGLEGADCEGGFTALGAEAGKREWTDYALSLKVKVASRGKDWRDGAWIGFRCADNRQAYTVGFYTRLSALHKLSQGRMTGDKNPLAESPKTIRDDQWHEVKITVSGAKIAVALDGEPIMEANDDNHNDTPAALSGGIALSARTHNKEQGSTRVLFKDLRVEALGDAPDAWKLRPADSSSLGGKAVSMLDFLRSRRERRYTQTPRKVLAFYYTWYGTPERHGRWVHWENVNPEKRDIASSTNYPARGAYDSHDPAIIDWHIDLAKGHGLDGFICTWWGQETFDDKAFVKVLDAAGKRNFEATVYWETAPGKGNAQVRKAVNDLLYVLRKYGGHPAFLKVDGKPVIFAYGRVMAEVPVERWPQIIAQTREGYGKDFLLIADGYSERNAQLFDGIHTYNICSWVRDKTPDELRELSRKQFADAVRLAKQQARISCITIIPGYDDTKIRKPGINARRQDGQTYRVLWEEAIAADPDWVLITSWNEWHEGSEIEPSHEDGDKYIRMTGEHAPRFKSTPFSKSPIPDRAAAADTEKAKAIRELYKGAAVGVLPGFRTDAVLWLADAGVEVKDLDWAELLDAERFNVKNFPVLVYARDEHYVQTVHQKGDVDEALLRYLREGGLLMALPTFPFPFYYNEVKEPVVSAARFGFPIGGSGAFGRADVDPQAVFRGWETPPADVKLSFRVDANVLPGAAGPFPDAGDRRWRPCNRAVLPEGDVYLPIAELVDEQGRSYGDAIAYIEHKVSPPQNGKNIYMWMRMPDVLGAETVWFGLFRLAAEKMTR